MTAEQLVKLLQTTGNPLELAHHMPDIVSGMADLLKRVKALEAAAKTPAKPA